MTTGHRRGTGAALAAVVGLLLNSSACDRYLRITDPNVIPADSLDASRDAATVSFSAQQSLATVYSSLIVHSAWFSGEAIVADPQPEPIEFGRREIGVESITLLTLWRNISAARSLGVDGYRLATAAPGLDVHAARAALTTGFAFVLAAESFCEGAVDGGARISSAGMLDSAIFWFDRAIASGRAVTSGTGVAEATSIVNAALVGRARAALQAGRGADAAASAAAVAAGFTYRLLYLDDAANRLRVGNGVWDLTSRRRVLAIAPMFRELGDPRVRVNAPSTALRPQDGITPYWTQAKYPGYAEPIRLASRLEADYILAEAQGTSAMLALIQSRRAANALAAYTGGTDAASVRAEFLRQRVREFYLEAKALGDTRRHPGVADYVPAPGTPYHRAGFSPIGAQSCMPLPARETGV